ncbi:hypothetical protein BAUCODRAFT_119603 [Baudoinia panamericana UAMH 10762]|uniref:Conserved oligomeric Golgi complex subunit 3 n=1 Tax=Baudoinia panamericana (strain UAMH 10762) TaxID=717646 RepID=M2NKS4_BAUPA|nr:uncharacterized protein BAUCODRAFT_119603 [Baudoinia panamericana UAMH 10762]EMD00045.1 hypothetical protein BAUCODRAFT_119603 [Baudoinia panamericana UAMH 10762]
MDDAWFHTLTATSTRTKEVPQHKRRPSLLQQPATLARRAQSYNDFYHAVRAFRQSSYPLERRRSRDSQQHAALKKSRGQDFDVDFFALEARIAEQSHAEHQSYHEQLLLSSSHLDNLLASTTSTLTDLSRLSESFILVEKQTNAFRQQCESLVAEQRRLSTLADGIEENARYYAFLEPVTRRLNAPGATNLVKGDNFPEVLHNLDNCLAYMESHPKQKDSATYRSRYRLLLTRALTLIRHHFTKSLADIALDISKRIQAGQLKDTTHSALLYAKFRVPAPELKALGLEIQKRAVPTPDDVDAGREPEYASLLRELYQSYSATRGKLMFPLVNRKMVELEATQQQAEVLAFAKASISFMRGVCLDEHELWREWFETDGALYEFLEGLMEPLYDHLRPKMVHETKLEKLCELCAMIQARYMTLEADDEEEVAIYSPAPNGAPTPRKLDFASLVQPSLEDAQTRLVFLALAALRDGIENYRPKPEDLDWPRHAAVHVNGVQKGPVLSGTRASVPPTPVSPSAVEDLADDAQSMFSRHMGTDNVGKAEKQWYPTLRKAIWLLRRIYRLVNSSVFDDLAHRIVHSTINSLITASQQIVKSKTSEDGRLFLIVHLLHLKQQIVAFDIEFVPHEVDFDFSAVTNTFYELRERGSLWNPASWVKLVSGAVGGGLLPKVVENMLDAKAELDGRLRTVINEFVSGYASHITAPIEPTTVSQAKAKEQFDALKAVRTVRGLAEKDVPLLRNKLEAYVDDARTRETLVAAVRDQVIMSYEDFFDAYGEGQGKRLSRKGKAREDEVWGPELFGEAMEKVFQVGQMVGQVDADSGSGDVSD